MTSRKIESDNKNLIIQISFFRLSFDKEVTQDIEEK